MVSRSFLAPANGGRVRKVRARMAERWIERCTMAGRAMSPAV